MDLSSLAKLKNGSPQERKEAFKRSLSNELAISNAQELLNSAAEKCFSKCVTKPSESLSSSEQKCLGQCLDRFFQTYDLINATYVKKMQEFRGTGNAAAGGAGGIPANASDTL